MAIKITTDSTCDVTKGLMDAHHIEVLPLYIMKDGVPYRDGVDITPDDIFRHVAAGGKITTTAAVNVDDYQKCFARLSPVSDAVIHINIGAEFSSCYQNALIAAASFPNVYVVDSRSLSSGQGHMVLEAARLAEQNLEPEIITAHLRSFADRQETSFLVDQLEYLRKGGRCSSVSALGANLLRLKPCIDLIDGKMRVGKKYRGTLKKALTEYARDRFMGRQDVDAERVIVVPAGCPKELVEMVCRDIERYTGLPPLDVPNAGCTISSHCGPCTLGIMFVRK